MPNISVLDYLKRIVRFTNVEVRTAHGFKYPVHRADLTSSKKACLLLILHYIDKISTRMPIFIFTSLTCHRFIIAAITASSKGLSDAFCTNQLYAKVGGITVTELNSLEREFLSAIDWQLMVSRFLFFVIPTQPTSLRSPTSSFIPHHHSGLFLIHLRSFSTRPLQSVLILTSVHARFSTNTTPTSSGQTAPAVTFLQETIPRVDLTAT